MVVQAKARLAILGPNGLCPPGEEEEVYCNVVCPSVCVCLLLTYSNLDSTGLMTFKLGRNRVTISQSYTGTFELEHTGTFI